MTDASPLLPERDAACAAAAALPLRRRSWFSRKATLAGHAPRAVRALAGVYLGGRGVRRESWTREDEMSEREYARLSKVDASPAKTPVARSFQVVEDDGLAAATACTHCGVRPGFGPCTRCIGTGRVLHRTSEEERWIPCGHCDKGFVRCTQCEGTTRVVSTTIRFVTDAVVEVEEWAVPRAAASALRTLRALGVPSTAPSQVCELASTVRESAYRGASDVVTPSFFGFELLDAAERARDVLAGLQSSLHAVQAQAFAVPFFLLDYVIGNEALQVVVRRVSPGDYVARVV